MVENRVVLRVVLPTIGIAVTSSLIAIVINYATEWRTNLLAWLAVVVLTLASAALSLFLWRRQTESEGGSGAVPGGSNDFEFGRFDSDGDVDLQAEGSNRWRSGRTKVKNFRASAKVLENRQPPESPAGAGTSS